MASLSSNTSKESKAGGIEVSALRLHSSEDGNGHGLVNAVTGHAQELKQTMSFWALLALSYSNMSVWTAIGGSLSAALTSGGPTVMVWSWVVVSVISLAIAASLAELCSAWPHAAGQAFWAYRLAKPKWAPFLSYWTALFNIWGAWAITAAGVWILSSEVLGIAVMFQPDYVQQPSHLVGVYLLFLILIFVCNIFAVRVFDAAFKGAAVLSVVAILAIIIALTVATPQSSKQSASFVFTAFLNTTGWDSTGLVVLLGMLQASFTIIGYDGACHLVEEAHDADRLGPLAVFWGVFISAIAGFAYILTLLFCIQDVDSVVGTPTAVPLLQIFQDSLGIKGATFCMFLNLFSLFLAMVGILCAGSRIVWSMARDKGLPFSGVLGRINPYFVVPIWALALNVLVPTLLILIYLGSQTIFFAFFQITTIGYLCSYGVPILLLLLAGRKALPMAPWRMSDTVGVVCNVVSVVYIVFISVMFLVPNYYPITAQNMNYTSPVLAVFIVIGIVGWYGGVRKSYVGPAAHDLTAEA